MVQFQTHSNESDNLDIDHPKVFLWLINAELQMRAALAKKFFSSTEEKKFQYIYSENFHRRRFTLINILNSYKFLHSPMVARYTASLGQRARTEDKVRCIEYFTPDSRARVSR